MYAHRLNLYTTATAAVSIYMQVHSKARYICMYSGFDCIYFDMESMERTSVVVVQNAGSRKIQRLLNGKAIDIHMYKGCDCTEHRSQENQDSPWAVTVADTQKG